MTEVRRERAMRMDIRHNSAMLSSLNSEKKYEKTHTSKKPRISIEVIVSGSFSLPERKVSSIQESRQISTSASYAKVFIEPASTVLSVKSKGTRNAARVMTRNGSIATTRFTDTEIMILSIE